MTKSKTHLNSFLFYYVYMSTVEVKGVRVSGTPAVVGCGIPVGIELRSSVRAAGPLNLCTISPAPLLRLNFKE